MLPFSCHEINNGEGKMSNYCGMGVHEVDDYECEEEDKGFDEFEWADNKNDERRCEEDVIE